MGNIAATIEKHLNIIESIKDDSSKAYLVPKNYEFILRKLIEEALSHSYNSDEFIDSLGRNNANKYFHAFIESSYKNDTNQYFSALTIDLIVIPALLLDRVLLEKFMRHLISPKNCDDQLWQKYANALSNLMGSSFDFAPKNKLSKIQKHWSLYIDYMDALAKKEDVQSILDEISTSFEMCNKDKLLTQATYIDPCGADPKSWDLRMCSINCIHEMYFT